MLADADAQSARGKADDPLFRPLKIKGVEFKNRLLRSSVGGRMCNYDGSVTDVWKNFEKRFADGGVGGIISTTFHVTQDRLSPPQYPSIAEDKYIPYLKKYLTEITRNGCKYIVQIGDPGYVTYSSLFPEEVDSKSSSAGFDLGFGYNNRRTAMSPEEIEKAIANYAAAAKRVQESGADGLEITATKGYLIHQFLNPGINRRNDKWGGDRDKRFHFLENVVTRVREKVGKDYLLGIRMSAADLNRSPPVLAIFRWPSPFLSKEGRGNNEDTMKCYARRLRSLGVDYLHVVNGYGFPNPHDTPGKFPFDEVKMFFNATRHLSGKAKARSVALNTFPWVLRWLLNIGWRKQPGINLEAAKAIKSAVGNLTVIVNGGFQERKDIEGALRTCDMVSMARALMANPRLPRIYEKGCAIPEKKQCTYCNRCVGRTGTSPLGCYELTRFADSKAMQRQIMRWNRPDPVQLDEAGDSTALAQRAT